MGPVWRFLFFMVIAVLALGWAATASLKCAAAGELHLTDRAGSTVYKTARSWGGGTVIRDSSGRTVGRVSRQFGSQNLVVRNNQGRTILRLERSRRARRK